jgi:hypothetical protein
MYESITEIVNRETTAWNNKNVDLLLSIFHADMVWVWPSDRNDHNPADWECPQGKFDIIRWRNIYENLFSNFDLVHNNREIVKIVCTEEQDGGFAVVDIDTLWRDPKTGVELHWLGRTCKTYVKTSDGVKMIAQTGALNYDC